MDFLPESDGFDHINVYSKSRSKLGRMLSNFAHTPFTIQENNFESVESWWYWTKMNNINASVLFPIFSSEQLETIKSKIGREAKEFFRALYVEDSSIHSPTKKELKEVYKRKLVEHPEIGDLLSKNKLPLVHYYVMFDKKINADSFLWTVKLWEEIKAENYPETF